MGLWRPGAAWLTIIRMETVQAVNKWLFQCKESYHRRKVWVCAVCKTEWTQAIEKVFFGQN